MNDVFGQGPIAKLYKFAIYDEALSDTVVWNTFSDGLFIPEPSTMTLLVVGIFTSLIRRRNT